MNVRYSYWLQKTGLQRECTRNCRGDNAKTVFPSELKVAQRDSAPRLSYAQICNEVWDVGSYGPVDRFWNTAMWCLIMVTICDLILNPTRDNSEFYVNSTSTVSFKSILPRLDPLDFIWPEIQNTNIFYFNVWHDLDRTCDLKSKKMWCFGCVS